MNTASTGVDILIFRIHCFLDVCRFAVPFIYLARLSSCVCFLRVSSFFRNINTYCQCQGKNVPPTKAI